MASVKYKLKLNASKIKEIEDAQKVALFKTIDALHTDVVQSQVMPFDTGTMQNEGTYTAVSNDGKAAQLITNTPYARRLYYHPEYDFQKTNNPNARGQWLEDYISGTKKDFCQETFEEFMRRELSR